MSIGNCPNCKTKIHYLVNGIPRAPLGNYRSVKFELEAGGYLTVPLCMDCHDAINEEQLEVFFPKLLQHIQSTLPNDWDEKRKDDFVQDYRVKKIKRIAAKEGPLSKEELKNKVVIWH